jgi:hypothetical protein
MAMYPVEPGAVTSAWLSAVLGGEVRDCTLEQIGVGVGLLGRLYRVHLTAGPQLPKSVVVKFPTLDPVARSAICEDLELYLSEVRFYQEIGLTNPLRSARPYFAAFDELTHDFVLVLEDVGGLRLADQTLGCTSTDAATVIDAIARQHAHWWESAHFATLPWLKTYRTPQFAAALSANFETAWPRFLAVVGDGISPALRAFGERFPSSVPWFLDELMRPPLTFLHGDLRLDQLFFAVAPDDPPVTALDWQLVAKGRGAYDVGYFLSQSLTTDVRRRCESELLKRYADRLAERGIDYPATELERDYRFTLAWCFIYPVLAIGQLDVANDRQLTLLHAVFERSASAIEDHGASTLRPD